FVDSEAMGRQIFAACRRFFEALARRQPLVLALDDYQWFDRSSVRLLEHLLPLVHTVPLLVLVSSRAGTETLTHLREALLRLHQGAYSELLIGPLSPGDGMRIVRHFLGSEGE